MISTTDSIVGHQVIQMHGIAAGNAVIGAGMFTEYTGTLVELLGAKSNRYVQVLNKAQASAISLMVDDAKKSGANAVVGVRIVFETLQKDNNLLAVAAYGTAVTVEKLSVRMPPGAEYASAPGLDHSAGVSAKVTTESPPGRPEPGVAEIPERVTPFRP